jgi:hypothetical protein
MAECGAEKNDTLKCRDWSSALVVSEMRQWVSRTAGGGIVVAVVGGGDGGGVVVGVGDGVDDVWLRMMMRHDAVGSTHAVSWW